MNSKWKIEDINLEKEEISYLKREKIKTCKRIEIYSLLTLALHFCSMIYCIIDSLFKEITFVDLHWLYHCLGFIILLVIIIYLPQIKSILMGISKEKQALISETKILTFITILYFILQNNYVIFFVEYHFDSQVISLCCIFTLLCLNLYQSLYIIESMLFYISIFLNLFLETIYITRLIKSRVEKFFVYALILIAIGYQLKSLRLIKLKGFRSYVTKKQIEENYNIYKNLLENVNSSLIIFSLKNNHLILKNIEAQNNHFDHLKCSINGEILQRNQSTFKEDLDQFLRQKEFNLKFHNQYSIFENGIERIFVCSAFINTYPIKFESVCIKAQEITQEINSISKIVKKEINVKHLCYLSHELRTPLNGAYGVYQSLISITNDPKMKSQIKLGILACKKLEEKIDEVLDYSQLSNKIFVLHPSIGTFQHFEKSIMKMYKSEAESKSIKLISNISEDILHKEFTLDWRRLFIIISNLISNAIKFTFDGKVVFTIKQIFHDLHFAVWANGIELTENQIKSLFKLSPDFNIFYHKNDKCNKLEGVGLYISNKICKKMNGKLEVISQKNEGSIFSFKIHDNEKEKISSNPNLFLPSENSNEDFFLTMQEFDEPLNKPKICFSTHIFPDLENIIFPHIIITDDNKMNRFVAKEFFAKKTLNIFEFENGKQCLEFYTNEITKTNRKFFILMDVEMPVMDGIEATKEIRKIEKEKNLPHCFINGFTAYASEEVRQKCMESGMNEFTTKPLTKEKVEKMFLQINIYARSSIAKM